MSDPIASRVANRFAAREVNIPRIERVIESIEKAAKGMRFSLDKYKEDPGKYEPQLENVANHAHEIMTSARVALRSLGESEV